MRVPEQAIFGPQDLSLSLVGLGGACLDHFQQHLRESFGSGHGELCRWLLASAGLFVCLTFKYTVLGMCNFILRPLLSDSSLRS